MDVLVYFLNLVLRLALFVVIAHVIMSWLINFQVLNIRQPLVAQIWYGLNQLLEPVYSRVRRLLPDLGGIDLAPVIVLIAIYTLQFALQRYAPLVY